MNVGVANAKVRGNIKALTMLLVIGKDLQAKLLNESPMRKSISFHPIFCNSIMLMQSRGNGFDSRSIMLHSYGTLSKGYTGVKCWQMCGMNPCRCNKKISCPGRQGPMVRYGTRSLTAGRSMGWWLTFWGVWGSNMLAAIGHLWKLVWIFCTWIMRLATGVQKGRLDGKSLFLWGERLRAEVSGASVSLFHLVTWVPFCGVLVFWRFGCFGLWFCCLLLVYGTQVFCNHCMSSSHTRESVTDKASCSIG